MFLFLPLLITLFTIPLQADLYTVYAHGIADKPSQVKRFHQAIVTDNNHTKSVEFLDTQKETGYGINRLISEITTYTRKPINRSKMHMAGPKDIQILHDTLQRISQEDNIILLGCSRGGATVINMLSQYNPKNIVAMILDASPASMPATIHPILAKCGIHHSYDKIIFSTLFPAYQQNAITPLKAIQTIQNKSLPILLIHSENDSKVPYCHSLQLYKELKNHGLTNVYLATIQQGRHAFLLQDQHAKIFYLQAVHSFYKKYNLPYDEQYAQDDMTQYQPSLTSVEQQIIDFDMTLQKQYEQNKQRMYIALGLITALIIAYLLSRKQGPF